MFSRSTLLIVSIFFASLFKGQEESGLVKWLTFAEAQEKYKEAPKPLLIDLYTDWCGWCKHMMRTTYSDAGIAAYINSNFYPVKFNAETKDTITYNGKVYKPLSKEPRQPHELTVKFLGEKMSYPSTMFVTNNYEYNLLSQGYLETKNLEPLLIFMTENTWQTTVFDEFNAQFRKAFIDTNYKKLPVRSVSFPELEKLMKKKPRKVLVNLSAMFCNTGKVMWRTTFTDTSVAAYINKNFYLVDLDVTRMDTIVFKGEKFGSTPVNNFPLHSLAFKISANRFSLPALCLLDEQLNTIDVLNYYQSPNRLRPILEFIATDAFKKQKFNDFMQEYMKPKPAKKK